MSRDLLIELLSEEMPSSFQESGVAFFGESVCGLLSEAGIKFNINSRQLFSSPRRLAVLLKDVSEDYAGQSQEIKGPKHSAPPAAIEGFLRKHNLSDISQCELREVGKDKIYFLHSASSSGDTQQLLPDIIVQAINNQRWKKSMRFGNQDFTWVRPLRHIAVMFGNECIKGELNLGGGEKLNFAEKIYDTASNYETILNKDNIFLTENKRINSCKESFKETNDRYSKIIQDLNKVIEEKCLEWAGGYSYEELLSEVNGLVESPYACLGKIDSQFIENLPVEVIMTSMKVHQKYFALFNSKGELAPYFAFIANKPLNDAIIKGNEKVLRARLQDGEYLLNEDKKTSLTDRADELQHMNFFHGLGTMHDKALRLQKLAGTLAQQFNIDKEQAEKTAYLLKADLMSEMVGEFPELQGVMGRYYAQLENCPQDMSQALFDQYRPRGSSDNYFENFLNIVMSIVNQLENYLTTRFIDRQDRIPRLHALAQSLTQDFKFSAKHTQKPLDSLKTTIRSGIVNKFPELQELIEIHYTTLENDYSDDIQDIFDQYCQRDSGDTYPKKPLSVAMSIIDKLDNLAGFWLIDKKPTGSKDPFALRRAALGIVHMLDQQKTTIDLQQLFTRALETYNSHDNYKKSDSAVLVDSLVEFCCERYKIYLIEQNSPQDIVQAVFATPQRGSTIIHIRERIEALDEFLKTGEAEACISAIKRMSNIVKSEKHASAGEVEEQLLIADEEKSLWHAYEDNFIHSQEHSPRQVLQGLVAIKERVDKLFENVMINDNDKKIRQNRLNLLKRIVASAQSIADFTHLGNR